MHDSSGDQLVQRVNSQAVGTGTLTLSGAIRCQTDLQLFYCLENHSCRSSNVSSFLLANSTSALSQHRVPMQGPPVPQP